MGSVIQAQWFRLLRGGDPWQFSGSPSRLRPETTGLVHRLSNMLPQDPKSFRPRFPHADPIRVRI